MLCAGMVIPSAIRILIRTGNKSEEKISDTISDQVAHKAEDIINKADDIKKML